MKKIASYQGNVKLNSLLTFGVSIFMFVLAIGDRFNWRFGLQAIFWLVITTLLAVLGKKKIMLEYSNSNQTIKISSKGEHKVYGIH